MNKAKQILIIEIRKIRSKAEQKRKEADRLDREADELQKKVDIL